MSSLKAKGPGGPEGLRDWGRYTADIRCWLARGWALGTALLKTHSVTLGELPPTKLPTLEKGPHVGRGPQG